MVEDSARRPRTSAVRVPRFAAVPAGYDRGNSFAKARVSTASLRLRRTRYLRAMTNVQIHCRPRSVSPRSLHHLGRSGCPIWPASLAASPGRAVLEALGRFWVEQQNDYPDCRKLRAAFWGLLSWETVGVPSEIPRRATSCRFDFGGGSPSCPSPNAIRIKEVLRRRNPCSS